MEKLLNPYDKEYMRMAMLKHEETFKEQVYELHRLYRIQKLLMKNIESRKPNGRNWELWSSNNGIDTRHDGCYHDLTLKSIVKLDLEQPADEYIAESNDNGALEIIDESEIELTLGPKSYPRRRNPETPLNSDSGPSFSSSSTGSSHINRTNFRCHQRRDTTREELGLVQISKVTPGYHKSSVEIEEQLRQERLKQPPWLFQVLSLNMT
ncbi:hypothetical protein CFOL_v3_02261 [Cephalotus follicularis]|uniref:Uncharacterized protein n=1 Tax=Cephalotus follicularis TaxID=3775 RepID=A0A1Q3ASM7_CEPFO|nr:hypothetical protein CFOL_v3_02261 [Cephalotus follicularis]